LDSRVSNQVIIMIATITALGILFFIVNLLQRRQGFPNHPSDPCQPPDDQSSKQDI
jgi:hypothetical protein